MKSFFLNSFICLNLSITTIAFSAERTLVMLGGGGEPVSSDSTIFDQGLISLDGYLKKNNWNHSISFNGGHSKSDEILNTSFPSAQSKNSFTAENFNTLIQNYENKIKSGQVKSGDQLMLMIATHGAMKSGNESTHQVAVNAVQGQTNLTNLSGATTVSIDKLKNLADLAKRNGIKLAILDFSCHSGNTISLANENTCVISSTGPKHFGYNTFAQNFIDKMKSGKTLEDVFLDTRKKTTDNSFPMISTPEGDTINRKIYPEITPYLYFYDKNPDIDKMTDYLYGASSKAGRCDRQAQYQGLISHIDSVLSPNNILLNKSFPEITRMKALLAQYKEQQDRYLDMLESWGTNELDRVEEFNGSATFGKNVRSMNGKYTWKEMLSTNFDRIIKDVTDAKNNTKDPAKMAMFQSSIDMHTKALNKQKEIISNYPNLKNYKDKFKEQMTLMNGTSELVNKISLEEKKLYDHMYEDLRANRTKNNPCKDFVL